MLEPSVKTYIEQLTAAYPRITKIWLFGSRANNGSRADSDWDLLVFGSRDILKSLRTDTRFHADFVDLLMVHNGNDFRKPWGEKPKNGSLSGWDWKEVDSNNATYRATKPKYDENGDRKSTRLNSSHIQKSRMPSSA